MIWIFYPSSPLKDKCSKLDNNKVTGRVKLCTNSLGSKEAMIGTCMVQTVRRVVLIRCIEYEGKPWHRKSGQVAALIKHFIENKTTFFLIHLTLLVMGGGADSAPIQKNADY